MSQRLLDKGGRSMISTGVITPTGTLKARLLSLNTTSNLNKAITAASNATPIVLTIATHGWTVGDILIIRGVGGNTSANGTYRIKVVVDANNVSLQTIAPQGFTALDVVGNGVYTSGGTALNISRAAASSTSTDIPAAAGSSTDQTLTSVTETSGLWAGTVPQFPSVAASTTLDALAFYQSAPTDRVFYLTDGKQLVRVTQNAATSAVAINVESLDGPIASGTVLVFSSGGSATLTSPAVAGDTTLAVSALAAGINKGHQTDAPLSGANLPVTTASGSAGTYTLTTDPTYGLFTI